MSSFTSYFALLELGPNDAWGTDNYTFSTGNMVVIDALLYAGASAHHHDGVSSSSSNPASAPTMTQSASGGQLPAGTIIYYEYTYANPIGLETAPSPVGNITTPSAIATPSAPGVTPTTGTGTLPPGTYLYVITGYLGASTYETLASLSTSVVLSSTGENTATWTIPSGATGVNIYRLGPGDSQYLLLTTVASPTATLTDNGTYTPNCNRSIPNLNTTNSQNEVVATIVAAPAGWTANLYRTTTSGSWGSSQIASGLTGTSYTDAGGNAAAVTPPSSSHIPNDPSKVLLTSGAEVQGTLPGSMVDLSTASGFPFAVTFVFPGVLSPTTGVFTWVCPFATATIHNVTCSLGVDSTPSSFPVKADVLLGTGVNPTYDSIFASATPVYPEVPVSHQVGAPQAPVTNAMVLGDTFQCSLLQSGGGATPTDHDLTVTILLFVTQ